MVPALLKDALKVLALSIVMFILNPIIHMPLDSIVSPGASITGQPNMPLLLALLLIQTSFLVIAFELIKDYVPGMKQRKGLFFMLFVLFAIQIPTVFGIIAFEKGADWLLFTPAKLSDYVTLIGDILIFLIIGILLGKLFPSAKESLSKKTKGIKLAMAIGAVAFPLSLMVLIQAINSLAFGGDFLLGNGSLWFNIVFFGIFFMTGIGLPLLYSIIVQNRKAANNVQFATFIFLLMWMPIQNFMVVFGWDFWGGFLFSLISIIPIFFVVYLADLLMVQSRKAN